MSRAIILLAAIALVVLVAADTEQFATGAFNRGATGAQSGNLAASAAGKQFAEGSNQAAESAKIAQGQRADARAALSANNAAFAKNAYEQRIAQSLVGVLSYCEGYICTEWLDEYGAAFTNAGAAAHQSAEGFGQQAQQASQFTDAERAAYAAQQQAALGEQARSATGALQGSEAYGQGAGASQAAYGTGYGAAFPGQIPWGGAGYAYGPAAGGISGSQASQLGVNSAAGQYGSIYGKEAAGVNARQAVSDKAAAVQSAAAQAKIAQANAAAAKQSAFTVEQLSRLKNYGRKCRRYQCYNKYWDGSVVSYGPNYYTATGQAANQNQAQAANQAAFADQAARAQQAAYAAEAGAANQYGAGAAGANEAAYGSGYQAAGSPYGYGYY